MLRNRLTKRTNGAGDADGRPFLCTIRFLDDSEPLSFTYQKDTRGQEMFDQICQSLDLLERDCFGLRFVDSEKQRHWLDMFKPIYRQLKHVHPATLCFRVKFYPSDPPKLREEITRYFLFLQLRRDLHHGRLLCSQQDANLLAAYIIQSEVGDFDPEEHLIDYVGKFKMLPKQTQRQEEKIMELHKTLTGQSPAVAESSFLQRASLLDTYGVDPHPVKDPNGNQIYLGVTHLGIVTFQGNKRTRIFTWSQITKVTFEGKMFIVHVTITEDETKFVLIQKKKHLVGYKCPTLAACKHLWQCAVEQRYFFTLQSSKDVPRVTSGGGIFSRGSRFRFSGRCEKEAYNVSNVERDEPAQFCRTSANPLFAQRYSSLRSGSVPTTFNALGLSEESLDSLSCRQGHWRSLDDFSRTSTPRRTMDLTDHMIPEEPSYDIMENFPGPCRSPPKMNRINNRCQYDDSYRDGANPAFSRAVDVSPTDDNVSSNRYDSATLLRRRLVTSDDGVQDNNLINSQRQELQSSALSGSGTIESAEVEATLRNGRTGNQSTGAASPPSIWRLVTFWTVAFVMIALGCVVIVAVVRIPGLISTNGATRRRPPDLQEVDPDQYD